MRRHLLCAEPEPKGKQDPLQVSPMQVTTPVGIKEDKSKKTVQREHRRGVQLLGLKEKQGRTGFTNRSLDAQSPRTKPL